MNCEKSALNELSARIAQPGAKTPNKAPNAMATKSLANNEFFNFISDPLFHSCEMLPHYHL
jgi:hypothetical protein